MGRLIELLQDDEEIPYRHPGTEGVIYVRRLLPEIRNEIQRRYQKTEHRGGRREVFIPEYQTPEVEKDLWDWIVLRWEGVASRVGSNDAAPCTRETKYKLPDPVRIGILALADEANLSGMRNGAEPAADPTSP
jgi:hypothetical protein